MSVFDEFGKVWIASSPLTDNFRSIKKAIDAGASTIVLKSVTSLANDEPPKGKRKISLHKLIDDINHREVPMPYTLHTTATDLDCEMISVKKSNELYDEIKKYSPKTKVLANLAPIYADDFNLANNLKGDAIEISQRWYDLGIKRPYYLLLTPKAKVTYFDIRDMRDKNAILMGRENAVLNAKVDMFDIKNGSTFFIGQEKTMELFVQLVVEESNNYWNNIEQKEEAFRQGMQSIYGKRPVLMKLARQGFEMSTSTFENMACDGITFSDSMKGGSMTMLAGMTLNMFGKGSLCGSLLTEETLAKMKFYKKHHPGIYVSASGGIMNADTAQKAINLGAGSVQLCSAIYFNGHKIIKDIASRLN
jgi:dihydroorotate dehydrogenase